MVHDIRTTGTDQMHCFDVDEYADVRSHLMEQYEGVFSSCQIERHIADYVGLGAAGELVDIVTSCGEGDGRVLDVGSGYGSFVLAARMRGYEAHGIEVAEYEVEYARKRLIRTMPGQDPQEVYRLGDANRLPYVENSYDVVTLWNVLEHVRDYKKVLSECVRVLKPNGVLFVVCPNYAAFRKEAHYGIVWIPMLPKCFARGYLRLRKLKADFFNDEIFYRTNWGVLHALWKQGLSVKDLREYKIHRAESIAGGCLRRIMLLAKRMRLDWMALLCIRLSMINPVKRSIALWARKDGTCPTSL